MWVRVNFWLPLRRGYARADVARVHDSGRDGGGWRRGGGDRGGVRGVRRNPGALRAGVELHDAGDGGVAHGVILGHLGRGDATRVLRDE